MRASFRSRSGRTEVVLENGERLVDFSVWQSLSCVGVNSKSVQKRVALHALGQMQ